MHDIWNTILQELLLRSVDYYAKTNKSKLLPSRGEYDLYGETYLPNRPLCRVSMAQQVNIMGLVNENSEKIIISPS